MKIDFSPSLVPELFIFCSFHARLSYVTISDRHSALVAFVRPWNLKWSRNCDKISLLWLLHLLIPCTLGRTFITIILMEISCFMASLSVVTAWLASSLFVAELSWWRKFNPLFSKWIPKWLFAQGGKLSRKRSFLASPCHSCKQQPVYIGKYMHTFNKLPITHARFQFSNLLETGNWWRTWENSWRIYCSFVQCCHRFTRINKDFPKSPIRKFTFNLFSPAMAKCLMKKFIRDFRLLLISKVTRTAVLPRTMTAKSIHNTVNCSVCKWKTKN